MKRFYSDEAILASVKVVGMGLGENGIGFEIAVNDTVFSIYGFITKLLMQAVQLADTDDRRQQLVEMVERKTSLAPGEAGMFVDFLGYVSEHGLEMLANLEAEEREGAASQAA
jgi:hypothetical protein